MASLGGVTFLGTSLLSLLNTRRSQAQQQRCISTTQPAHSSRYNSPDTIFDVIIVGAGPAGATAAYYLGKQGLRVALIDKRQFPRPKPCGDAWCKPGLDILEEMGVLQKMEADQIVRPVQRGGFISPFGYRCINTDGSSSYGSVTGCKTYAIKRYIADEYLVKAAVAFPSVQLFENTEVTDLDFILSSASASSSGAPLGYYTATTKSEQTPSLRGTMCLICDGSTSYLAQKMGIIPKSQSEAVCSHCYVKGGTHQWQEADGVMIFNKSTLPGYSALFRHYNDDMYFGMLTTPAYHSLALRQEHISSLGVRQPREPSHHSRQRPSRTMSTLETPSAHTMIGRSVG
jgi:menaquinone-9 beta-reductase